MQREKNVGGFISETLEVIAQNGVPIVLFVVVLGSVTASATLFGLIGVTETTEIFGVEVTASTPILGGALGLYAIAITVLSVLASYFLLAAMLQSRGRLPSSDTRILAYVGLTILSTLGMMVGFLLLIIPGIIILVRWSAAPAFLLSVRTGIVESLGRSWEATSGAGWAIFLAGLILAIGYGILVGIFVGFGELGGFSTISTIFASFLDVAGSAFSLAFTVAVFSLVHNDSEAIGEVFT